MLIPEIQDIDMGIIPDSGIDLKIWINQRMEDVKENQPLFHNYLIRVAKLHGGEAVTVAFMVFNIIENALQRESYL